LSYSHKKVEQMNQQETLDRILFEARTRSIPATENYTPTSDHYVPLRLFYYYATLLYGIGYDEGKKIGNSIKPIVQKKNGEIIRIWPGGQAEAAKHFNVPRERIHKVLSGKRKTCFGFEWEHLQ
jgi:hypothetical protein